MAEHIRRPGGEMVPYRGHSSRRNLLPVEVQIIEALDLTEEEYWHFCDLTAAYNGKRSKEYDHVPDIRCDPITPAMWTVIAINLAVGVALTAVSFLLRPKPKEQGATAAPPSLETDDSIGSKRFAPTSSFSAVQSLATLGSPVPLVFCRRENNNGGVRVNGQLLWSHLASKSGGQELRALMLISAGKLESEPEYNSYAIGDNKLCNISPGKIALYFKRNGGRTIEGNLNGYSNTNTRYPEGVLGKCSSNDAYAVQWLKTHWTYHEKCFSGCRNPSGSSQFGVYSPLPNANEWRMEHELILVPKHDGRSKELEGEQQTKKEKVYWGKWSKRCYVAEYSRQGNDNPIKWPYDSYKRLEKGDYFNYIVGSGEEDTDYEPWGTADVRNAVLATRQNAADTLMIGELYVMGGTIAVLTEIKKDSGEAWKDKNDWWRAWFRVVDAGDMRTYRENYKKAMSINTLVLMRAAVATVANNRECDCTEIGIKSKVFGRISAPNVNSIPSEWKVKRYQEKGGNISLGRIDQYITRFSFFQLEARNVGDVVWWGLFDGSYFCVEGRTPTAIFNSIKIYHPRGQYEFRLRPCSANYIHLTTDSWKRYHRLRAIGGEDTPNPSNHHRFDKQIKGETFTVVYAGQFEPITKEERCNKEWIVHEDGDDWVEGTGWNSPFRDSGWQGNLNKFDAMSDYWAYDSEQKSHESAPEHEVTFVNELLIQDAPAQYPDMAYAGIRIQAGQEINTFTQFSAFIERGMIVPGGRLIDGTTQSTNLLPEIAWSLLVSNIYGLGTVVGIEGVDRESMKIAAMFCKKNGFTWNGVIGKKVNIRDWIFEQAGYCFLDFVVKGGLFSLKPSVVYSSKNYVLRKNADLRRHVKALFTDGNITDLKTTFLSAEDRQEFQAVCLWRNDKKNGFPETRTVSVRRNVSFNTLKCPEETFDMSGWCTSEDHAIKWAKWAVLNRIHVDHAVTFKTTPDCIVGMEPGNLFRLQTEASHVTRFSNGSVDPSGNIQSREKIPADKHIYYWKPGTEGVKTGRFKYEKSGGQNTTLAAEFLRGCLFATYSTTTSEFIYKCESISHAEDGFIELTGVYQPIHSDGTSKLLDWDDTDWIVERS